MIRSVQVPRQRHRGESMEQAARRIRYQFLEEVRKSFEADWIGVGHNSDDVVETMLLNFLRGTGVSGLCGLLGRRGRIVRPLIHCSRLDLRDFLLEHGQPWREDETNTDTRYLRNRLRLELIPSLVENYNPNFREKMLFLRESLIPCREFLEERGRGASLLLRRNLPLAICAWDCFHYGAWFLQPGRTCSVAKPRISVCAPLTTGKWSAFWACFPCGRDGVSSGRNRGNKSWGRIPGIAGQETFRQASGSPLRPGRNEKQDPLGGRNLKMGKNRAQETCLL